MKIRVPLEWPRTREKMCSQISKKAADILNKKEGLPRLPDPGWRLLRVLQQRLEDRPGIRADLFLSIHADAARARSAKGMSIYSCQPRCQHGSRQILAKKRTGRYYRRYTHGDNKDESDPIVLNMFKPTPSTFQKLMQPVFSNMKVFSRQIQHGSGAPSGLQLPEIPSLLVETAYISNKRKRSLLRSSRYPAGLPSPWRCHCRSSCRRAR